MARNYASDSDYWYLQKFLKVAELNFTLLRFLDFQWKSDFEFFMQLNTW